MNRVVPDGTTTRMKPANAAALTNAHHIKLSRDGTPSVWDSSYEKTFDVADSAVPNLVEWVVSGTAEVVFPDKASLSDRWVPLQHTDIEISMMTEVMVSLAVRSPMARKSAAALAVHLRGPLPDREVNMLAASNLQHNQRNNVRRIGNRGKFGILLSRETEFIFGDGFFHNLVVANGAPNSPQMVVPFLPTAALLHISPTSCSTYPRLCAALATAAEVQAVNASVKACSSKELFYRCQRPDLLDGFEHREHGRYTHPDNPAEAMLRTLPGVGDRDRTLDRLFGY